MAKNWPYSPGDTIESAKDNADKDGLATGENDYPNNSLQTFRSEAFVTFFRRSGAAWSIISGLNGQMSAGAVYDGTSGNRVVINAVATQAFTANQDTYVFVDTSDGTIRYSGVSNNATPPSINAGESLLAIIVTGASAITSVIQSGADAAGRLIKNTSPTGQRAVPITISQVNPATLTPAVDQEMFIVSGQAQTLTINAPTGTLLEGMGFSFRFKDNGTARTLSWNSIYRAVGVTIPTATVANKWLYVFGRYNRTDNKVDILSVGRE